jgi:hypothetical protein
MTRPRLFAPPRVIAESRPSGDVLPRMGQLAPRSSGSSGFQRLERSRANVAGRPEDLAL